VQPAVLPRAARGGPLPVTRSPLGLLGSLPAAARAGQPPARRGGAGGTGAVGGKGRVPFLYPRAALVGTHSLTRRAQPLARYL